jgi:hypothetical protein
MKTPQELWLAGEDVWLVYGASVPSIVYMRRVLNEKGAVAYMSDRSPSILLEERDIADASQHASFREALRCVRRLCMRDIEQARNNLTGALGRLEECHQFLDGCV